MRFSLQDIIDEPPARQVFRPEDVLSVEPEPAPRRRVYTPADVLSVEPDPPPAPDRLARVRSLLDPVASHDRRPSATATPEPPRPTVPPSQQLAPGARRHPKTGGIIPAGHAPLGTMPILDSPRVGAQQVVKGAKQLAKWEPGTRLDAASDILEGAMKAFEPAMVATAPVNPLAVGRALVHGAAVMKGAEVAGDALGARPDVTRLAGNVGGIFAGGMQLRKTGKEFLEGLRTPRAAAAPKAVTDVPPPAPTSVTIRPEDILSVEPPPSRQTPDAPSTITADDLLNAPVPKTFAELPPLERREVRRMLAELDEFKFDQPGRPKIPWWEAQGETPLAGARQPNAPVIHDVNTNTKRTGLQVREAGRKWVEGTGRPTTIVADLVRVARQRAYHGVDEKAAGGLVLPEDAGHVEGELYPAPRRLGKPDAAKEQETIATLDRNRDALRAQYEQQFGRVYNADNASEVLNPHEPNARWAHHDAVRSSATALTQDLFNRALAEPVNPNQDIVRLTGGGTGSGKSSVIADGDPQIYATLDSTLSDFKSSKRNIDAALASGRPVELRFVYRDPIEAFMRGVVTRAADPKNGRPVPIASHARTHAGAPDTLLRLAEHYEAEPYVSIRVNDNTVPGRPERSLEWLRAQAARYNDRDGLEAHLRAALDVEVEAGRVSPVLARRLGAVEASRGPGERVGPPDSRRAGEPFAFPAPKQVAPADRLATGELQPRLPGDVGNVRDVEVPTPKFELPKPKPDDFELTSTDVRGVGAKQGALFDAPQASPTRALYEPPTDAGLAQFFRGRPVSEPQVVERLQELFTRKGRELPTQTGRNPALRTRALGLYFPKAAIIRLRKSGDLPTFAHELGHHIDFGLFPQHGRPVGLFRGELEALGAATTPPGKIGTSYHVHEGVAEFFRTWLADPAAARQAAPNFTAALDQVAAGAPAFGRQLTEAQGLVRRYLAQPAGVRGAARVSVAPLGLAGRVKDVAGELRSNPERGGWTRRFASALRDTGNLPGFLQDRKGWMSGMLSRAVDRHTAIRQAEQDYAPFLPKDESAYALARLADKSAGMAESAVKHGPRGLHGTRLGPGLEQAIAPVHHRLYPPTNQPQKPALSTYLVAKRMIELHTDGRGREPGMPMDEAQAIVRATEADPEFSKIHRGAEGVWRYLKGLRHYAEQYGAMSADQVKQLEDAAFYVPVQRVREAEGFVMPGSRKLADRQSPIKRLKGSGRDVIDPIDSIIRMTFDLTTHVEKNRTALALTKLADTKDSGALLQEIKTPEEMTKFNLGQVSDEVIKRLVQAGFVDPSEITGAKVSGLLDTLMDDVATVYTPTAFGKPGERILFVMDHGKRRFFQIQDEALYQNLVNLGPSASQTFPLAAKAASAVRAGVTIRPTFAAKNLIRDTLGAFFQSRHGFIPIVDNARGFWSMVKNDADYQRYQAFGLGDSTFLGHDRNQLRAAVNRSTRPPSLPRKLFKPVLQPKQFLQDFSSQLETATRMGEFKLALDAGGKERRAGALGIAQRLADRKPRPAVTEETLTTAALAASDVTVDFSRGGTFVKDLSSFSPFTNARAQGLVRAAETIKRDPLGTAINVATVTGLAAALWAWNHDDPAYQELDPERKKDYWFVKLPGSDYFLTIPKPFEWAVPANLVEAALDATQKERPESLHPVRRWAKEQGLEFVSSVAPSIVLPTLEVMTNFDLWAQRPIVSPFSEGREPDLQVNDWTSDTARAASKALGVSPAKLEHFATKTFGPAVKDATALTDVVARQALERGRPVRPKEGLERVPGLGAVLAPRRIDSRADSIQQFYNEWNELQGALQSSRAYRKGEGQTDPAAFDRVAGAKWTPARQQAMKTAKSAIDDLRASQKAVSASRELDAGEKRRRTDLLNAEMARIARAALTSPQAGRP
jgi:hypothetical protein